MGREPGSVSQVAPPPACPLCPLSCFPTTPTSAQSSESQGAEGTSPGNEEAGRPQGVCGPRRLPSCSPTGGFDRNEPPLKPLLTQPRPRGLCDFQGPDSPAHVPFSGSVPPGPEVWVSFSSESWRGGLVARGCGAGLSPNPQASRTLPTFSWQQMEPQESSDVTEVPSNLAGLAAPGIVPLPQQLGTAGLGPARCARSSSCSSGTVAAGKRDRRIQCALNLKQIIRVQLCSIESDKH